ncbi:gfo/Idh/MocA family oxidoreductase [Paenibacillaceae bacterium]|nr:gfo/Idh/MocA family oxidoreductase [Paenibacillaceae bacterium]
MKLGIIGFGNRIQTVVREIMQYEPACRIQAITDVRNEEIRNEMAEMEQSDIHYYESPDQMLEKEKLDGVLIGTRCSLHTQMALKVFGTGLPLYLEKPVATTMEDLLLLKQGYEETQPNVVVSFPLRATSPVLLIKEIIASGKIGTVEHVQAVNNVSYGSVYYQSWYRDEAETGGLFLQKATHDFDYINAVLGLKPVSVCAMTSKQIFKGDKPAALECKDCEEQRTCPQSTVTGFGKGTNWKYCCFAEDTGNEDSGSALIQYESGMHVSYSQNFFARRGAEARGARFLGYKGTVEFDFYTGIVKVFMHHTPSVETYELKSEGGHYGGDTALAGSFVELMRGGSERSIAPLEDGLLSALMCLKARESAVTHTFQPISW